MEFDKSRVYTALNADELKQGDKVIVGDSLRFLRQEVEGGGYIETLKEVLDESHLQRFKAIDGVEWGLAYLVERKENCTNCGEGKWDAEHQKIHCNPAMCGNDNVVFRNHEIEVCEYWKPKTEHDCQSCKYKNCGFKDFNTKNECDRWEAEVKAEKKCEDCTIDEICVEGKKIYKDAPCPYHRAKPHYRPFRDTDELIKVFCEKTPKIYDKDDEKLFMPYIWVRRKGDNSDKGSLITAYGKTTCIIAEVNLIGADMTRLFTDFEFLDGSPCGVEE